MGQLFVQGGNARPARDSRRAAAGTVRRFRNEATSAGSPQQQPAAVPAEPVGVRRRRCIAVSHDTAEPSNHPYTQGGRIVEFEKLLYDVQDGICTITINNEKALNALSTKVLKELDQAITAAKNDGDVKAVILTGAGKAFVAGADIRELNNLGPLEAVEYARTGQHLTIRIESMPKPVIAAVNGFALGGGCELAMACTLRVASTKAVFGQPEVKLGLIPGFGGTQRLPRLVGPGVALELLLTGDNINADEAYRIGLANKVVEPEELLDKARELADKMMQVGPVALRFTKDACYRGLSTTLTDGLRIEADLFGASLATDDAKEGTAAFLEKRGANFKGQ
ncbi:crotonase [bacterium]|nr:crotonase [bacterium]